MSLLRLPTIPGTFEGKTFLVTGGSGFVGSVLIYRLVHGPIRPKRVYAIVRGPDPVSRLPAFLLPFVESGLLAVLDGQCTSADLGLSKQEFDELHTTVDVVIHAAADTKFDRTLSDSIAINVTMAHVLAAFSVTSPSVKTHVQVSSAFINHWLPDGASSYESLDQVIPSASLRDNTYSHAKTIAEGVVHAFARAGSNVAFVNLRLSSIAPSIECPHPAYGSALKASPLAAGIACDDLRPGDFLPNATWDTVPVDVCVDQMLALTASILHYARPSSFTTYHVSAGPQFSFPVDLLTDPAHRVTHARARVSRAKFLAAYGPSLEKTVHFINEAAGSVFRYRNGDKNGKHEGGPIDVDEFLTDLRGEIESRGGWSTYLKMIKDRMDQDSLVKLQGKIRATTQAAKL